MSAVPESFDGMLAELAETAAAGVTLPDLADVRRRARQRTVRRRLTASAVAFALVCVSGVAGAAIDGRFGPRSKISAVSAPSGSSAPLGTTPVPSSSKPAPSPSASAGANDSYYAAYVGLWAAKQTNSYVMVFPDGVVGLTQDGSFPLCYGQALATTSASAAANAGALSKDSATGSAGTAPTAESTSGVTIFTASLPFTAVACTDSGTVDGLTLRTAGGSETLDLIDAENAKIAASGYADSYDRVFTIASAVAGTDQQVLARLAGQWVSVDGSKRVLKIDGDGSVTYTTAGLSGAADTGSGEIDAYYASGARVLTACSLAQQTQMLKDGEEYTFSADQVCGVLLIAFSGNAQEIIAYTGTGVEDFRRSG